MLKKTLFAVCLGLAGAVCSPAQEAPARGAGLEGSPVYSDPGFQDFIETSYGYLSKRGGLPAGGLRDAVAAPAAPRPAEPAAPAAAVKTGPYVFVSILPKEGAGAGLIKELAASAGFVRSAERPGRRGKAKTARLRGWARVSGLAAIRNNPGVAGLRVGRKAARPVAPGPRPQV